MYIESICMYVLHAYKYHQPYSCNTYIHTYTLNIHTYHTLIILLVHIASIVCMQYTTCIQVSPTILLQYIHTYIYTQYTHISHIHHSTCTHCIHSMYAMYYMHPSITNHTLAIHTYIHIHSIYTHITHSSFYLYTLHP